MGILMAVQHVDEWPDALGNTMRPGDLVIVSTINGRSPQGVVARIVSLNSTDSKGNLLVDDGAGGAIANTYMHLANNPPTVTVSAVPILDLRGFRRWGSRGGENKTVNYKIVSNIIRLCGDQLTAIQAHLDAIEAKERAEGVDTYVSRDNRGLYAEHAGVVYRHPGAFAALCRKHGIDPELVHGKPLPQSPALSNCLLYDARIGYDESAENERVVMLHSDRNANGPRQEGTFVRDPFTPVGYTKAEERRVQKVIEFWQAKTLKASEQSA